MLISNIFNSISLFADNNPILFYILLALALVIQGEIAILFSMYLIKSEHLDWPIFLSIAVCIVLIEEILLYLLGRGIRRMKHGELIAAKIPFRQKIESTIKNNLLRSAILGRFMWIYRFVAILNGYIKTDFKKFLRANFTSYLIWFVPITTLAYTFVSTFGFRRSREELFQSEIGLLVTVIIIIGGEWLIRNYLRKKIK